MTSSLDNLWLPRTFADDTQRNGRRTLVVARAGGERFALAFSNRDRAQAALDALRVPMADLILSVRGNHGDVIQQLDASHCVGVLCDYDARTGEAQSAIRLSSAHHAPAIHKSRVRRAS